MKASVASPRIAPPRGAAGVAHATRELTGAEATIRLDAAVEEACRPMLNHGHLVSQADGGERLGELAVRSVAAGLMELGVIVGGKAWRAELEAVPRVAELLGEVQRTLKVLLKVRAEEMAQGKPLTRIAGEDFSFAPPTQLAKERRALGAFIRDATIDLVATHGEKLRHA